MIALQLTLACTADMRRETAFFDCKGSPEMNYDRVVYYRRCEPLWYATTKIHRHELLGGKNVANNHELTLHMYRNMYYIMKTELLIGI